MAFANMQLIDISVVNSYPAHTAPQVSLSFDPMEYMFLVEGSNDAVALISFDGINDHFQLEMGKPNQGIVQKTRAKKVWFKRVAGATCKVRVVVSSEG